MLPDALLLHRREGGSVLPRFLESGDLGWLEEMLVRRERAIGRPQLELEEMLRGEDAFPKRRLVARVLAGLARPRRESVLDPGSARAALFAAATESRIAGGFPRERTVAIAAERLGVSPAEIEASLFADLPGERRVAPLPAPVSAETLRRRVNAALAGGFLLRAVRVTVTTDRDPLPLVRHARRSGLIAERRDGAVFLSGPFALFRNTALYGRALAGILPVLASLGTFTAQVDFILRGTAGRLVLDAASPVFSGESVQAPATSPIARLVRAIHRRAPGWAAIPDPEPLAAADDGALLDADLLLVPPGGGPGWRVELLRFWTADLVRRRVERWAAAGVNALLLLDDARNGTEEPAPEHPAVILFRTRPAAEEVLARIASS